MASSGPHRHVFAGDFEWLVIPALANRQFRLFRRDNVPLAYVSWAFLSEETEERFKRGEVKLAPKEWTAGDRVWIVDLVTPYGAELQILKDLDDSVFVDPGQVNMIVASVGAKKIVTLAELCAAMKAREELGETESAKV
jgi:cytolysin-activating lysine-acyltransferase